MCCCRTMRCYFQKVQGKPIKACFFFFIVGQSRSLHQWQKSNCLCLSAMTKRKIIITWNYIVAVLLQHINDKPSSLSSISDISILTLIFFQIGCSVYLFFYISIQVVGSGSKVFQAVALYSVTFCAGAQQRQQPSVSAGKRQTESFCLRLGSCAGWLRTRQRRICCVGSVASLQLQQMHLFLQFYTVTVDSARHRWSGCALNKHARIHAELQALFLPRYPSHCYFETKSTVRFGSKEAGASWWSVPSDAPHRRDSVIWFFMEPKNSYGMELPTLTGLVLCIFRED